jgi:hypothetical protein
MCSVMEAAPTCCAAVEPAGTTDKVVHRLHKQFTLKTSMAAPVVDAFSVIVRVIYV